MRMFYEAYPFLPIRSPAVNEMLSYFWDVGFSHHYLIITQEELEQAQTFKKGLLLQQLFQLIH